MKILCRKLLLLGIILIIAAALSSPGYSAMKIKRPDKPSATKEAPEKKAPPKKQVKPIKPSAKKVQPIKPDVKRPPAKQPTIKKASENAKSKPVFVEEVKSYKKGGFGNIVFTRGSQAVAEFPEGATENQRYNVFDKGLRRKGQVKVMKSLEPEIFLVRAIGSTSISAGDRLVAESEKGAAARVLRRKSKESIKEFIRLFPESKYVTRMHRELFRLDMRSDFPTLPGTTIKGRVVLGGNLGDKVPLDRALIVVDKFVVAMTDENGSFKIEGLPPTEKPVKLKMRVKDPKFLNAKTHVVELAAKSSSVVETELPIKLKPTVLVGQVVDENGNPVAGAEVWTSPFTMEALTDEQGSFSISRKKKFDAADGEDADEPLFGRDYEVYAYRKGSSVEFAKVSAESFIENRVPVIAITDQDPLEEEVPGLDVDLRANLDLMQFVVPHGSDPKINQ